MAEYNNIHNIMIIIILKHIYIYIYYSLLLFIIIIIIIIIIMITLNIILVLSHCPPNAGAAPGGPARQGAGVPVRGGAPHCIALHTILHYIMLYCIIL